METSHDRPRRSPGGWWRLALALAYPASFFLVASVPTLDRLALQCSDLAALRGVEVVAPGSDTRDLDAPQRPDAGRLHTELAPGVYFWRSNT